MEQTASIMEQTASIMEQTASISRLMRLYDTLVEATEAGKDSQEARDCAAGIYEILKLRSMCRAAGKEIDLHWDAHCGPDGYGPRSLVERLTGKQQTDLYPGHITPDEWDACLKSGFCEAFGAKELP